MLGDDPDALAEVVDAFLDEAPQRLLEIRAGVNEGDATLAGRAAHTLKANAATFGATRLEQLCRELELAARSDELGDRAHLIDEADGEWQAVRSALTQLRGQETRP